MKATTSLLFTFFLISLSTYSLASTPQSPDPVRDLNGDILRARVQYYIEPGFHGMGGGLTLASTRNETCPLDVVQEPFELQKGAPLTFTPVNSKKGVIRESTDLNIEFTGGSICSQSLVWKLDNYEGKNILSTGGVIGNPGRKTLGSWFKIEKYLNMYKLVFCPTVCDTCKPVCGDIGVSDENGTKRLVVSDKPLMVTFGKA